MTIAIRPYRSGDLPEVAALWSSCFNYPAKHNDPRLSIDRKVAVDDGLFFVSVIGEKISGTVMAGWDGHRGWIYSLAVHRDHRRLGIGTALVEFAVSELVKLGCPKVNLQVMPGNASAVGFYETLGFQVEDRVSMGRRLYE